MRFIIHPESACASQVELSQRLVDRLGHDYEPTHIVLDLNDYAGDSSVLDEFRDIAFSWTPGRPKDGVPPYLLDVMNDPACTHLVWLSCKALGYTDQLFVWVLAHELRHLYQSRHGFPRECIRITVRELRRKLEFTSLPPSVVSDPAEIDSELCGLREASAMFGTEQLRGIPLPRCPYPAYARLLQEVEGTCFP